MMAASLLKLVLVGRVAALGSVAQRRLPTTGPRSVQGHLSYRKFASVDSSSVTLPTPLPIDFDQKHKLEVLDTIISQYAESIDSGEFFAEGQKNESSSSGDYSSKTTSSETRQMVNEITALGEDIILCTLTFFCGGLLTLQSFHFHIRLLHNVTYFL